MNVTSNHLKYYVYLLECSDNSFYCGYTTDLKRRVSEHNNPKSNSKYTRVRIPVQLVYYEEFKSLSDALKREHKIKKLNHAQKLSLISL